MYKPKERLRHALAPMAPWTAEQAARSRLFSPLELASGLVLEDRTWIPAMVPWRSNEEGVVTPEVLAWYRRFAEGAPGAIVVEATGIREVPSGPLLRIGHDRFVEGLRRLTDAVREASRGKTRLFIQLIDFLRIRRRPDPERFFSRFLRITPQHRERLSQLAADPSLESADETVVRERLAALDQAGRALVLSEREREALERGDRERVSDVDVPEIRELPATLPGLFADAAARAARAGFDGVELHYAHAYTMASFLSRLNTRADGYGATLEGRLRLPLEVARAVRDRVGASFTVGVRFLCDEAIDGGNDVGDACALGVALANAGVDFVSLSTGGKFEDAKQPKIGEAAYPYTGRSGFECMPTALSDARGPFARNVAKQSLVRRAIREAGLSTPVVVAGGIGELGLAEAILERGDADLIGVARQSLADPDWPEKARAGRASEIRRCTYSSYCEGLDQKHRMVTCQLWDRLDLDEPGAQTTDGGRRRLIAPRWER
ncbi:MAG: NADH:flavin oxidoreductase [Polyangiaceae bacterium]|nr:NADH:flavin oxidoreductase [Polyangiaceae bacterium]